MNLKNLFFNVLQSVEGNKICLPILFWVFGSVGGFVHSQTSSDKIKTAKPVRILAFGDSLTAGYRLKPLEAYPQRLEARLREWGLTHVSVVNAGVSGDTSGQGVRRIPWTLKRGPFDFVILALGANDGLRLMPVENLESNLEKSIVAFKSAGAKVILAGIRIPINLDPNYRDKFEAVYPRLAKKYKLPFYPFLLEGVAAEPSLNLDDQIHPNALGHKIIADRLADFVKTLL